ncbi:MAG: MATE family efflux transporter [Ignavibacteria bacterium]|nr:MATE family efflux transporter [Ignavibacteria bacterium]
MKSLIKSPLNTDILRIALPAIAGLSTQIILSIVDAAMIGRLNNAEYALAAMGLSVLATWAIVSFFSSLATGTHVLIARRFGQKAFEECSIVLYNSFIIGIILGTIVCLLGMFFSHPAAQFLAKDPRVGQLAGEFIFYRFIGLPFFLITVSYRGFYFGIGNTRVFMVSGIIINLLNIFFNYVLIYGKFGLPAMGIAGSGLGSSLATICDSLYYFLVSLGTRYRQKYRFFHNLKFSKEIIRSIFKISLPVSFQNIFILLGFLIFVAITGLIGTRQQAATQAIISTLFMSFLPCFGFGIAVQTLVGNSIGKGENLKAKLYGLQTVKIATIYTVTLSIVFICFPQYLLWLITEDKSILELARPAMQIAGFAQIFYGIGIVLSNGLQAIGKTRYVMFAEVFTNLGILVPFSYLIGVVWGYGITGAWFAMPLYIIVYSILISVRFHRNKWQEVQHI